MSGGPAGAPPSGPASGPLSGSASAPSRLDKFERLRILGRGAFGVATLVKELEGQDGQEGELRVIKAIDLGQLTPSARREAKTEIEVLAKFSHPNIVEYVDAFLEPGMVLNIVMEFADGGDLAGSIRERRDAEVPFPEDTALAALAQCLQGLAHVHARRVLHRDIKGQNIFLTSTGTVKLGDFGIAKVLDTASIARTMIGTPNYLAPEVCESLPYGNKADIWSIGIVYYELLALQQPFQAHNIAALVLKIVRAQLPETPKEYSQEARRLATLMLQRDPDNRPDAPALLNYPKLAEQVGAKFYPSLEKGRGKTSHGMPPAPMSQESTRAPSTAHPAGRFSSRPPSGEAPERPGRRPSGGTRLSATTTAGGGQTDFMSFEPMAPQWTGTDWDSAAAGSYDMARQALASAGPDSVDALMSSTGGFRTGGSLGSAAEPTFSEGVSPSKQRALARERKIAEEQEKMRRFAIENDAKNREMAAMNKARATAASGFWPAPAPQPAMGMQAPHGRAPMAEGPDPAYGTGTGMGGAHRGTSALVVAGGALALCTVSRPSSRSSVTSAAGGARGGTAGGGVSRPTSSGDSGLATRLAIGQGDLADHRRPSPMPRGGGAVASSALASPSHSTASSNAGAVRQPPDGMATGASAKGSAVSRRGQPMEPPASRGYNDQAAAPGRRSGANSPQAAGTRRQASPAPSGQAGGRQASPAPKAMPAPARVASPAPAPDMAEVASRLAPWATKHADAPMDRPLWIRGGEDAAKREEKEESLQKICGALDRLAAEPEVADTGSWPGRGDDSGGWGLVDQTVIGGLTGSRTQVGGATETWGGAVAFATGASLNEKDILAAELRGY